MAQVGMNEVKVGMRVEVDTEPYTVVGVEFVKPGKGQAFTRTKLRHLLSGRVIERTFKSGEKLDVADVEETEMRMLYQEGDGVVFMHDTSFEQLSIPFTTIGDKRAYLIEDTLYGLLLYKGKVVDVIPPIFLNMTIVETAPGVRGDTASGRVLKPAKTNTGAVIQIPIFIEEGTVVKIDTRTGEYVSRVKE